MTPTLLGMATSVRARIESLTPDERLQWLRMLMPRVCSDYMPETPHPKQQLFLTLTEREVLFGGAAGPGKTSALLMAALQYVDVPGYSALLLRRTWSDLNGPGGPMDRMSKWLQDTAAEPHEGGRYWTFPSTARITFGYLQHENDKYRYQGHEHTFIGVDELTQFGETQYEYLFSRLRKPQLPCVSCGTPVRKYAGGWKHTNKAGKDSCRNLFPDPAMVDRYAPAPDGVSLWDVPLRMRTTSNPGGVGHEWVYRRLVDPRTKRPGTVFLPASLYENPFINHAEYRESLEHLGVVERERLLRGDWTVVEHGGMFERSWFDVVDEAPNADIPRCRFWDMAASEGKGDYTVGTLLALQDGIWYIEHQIRGQWGPGETEAIIKQTAKWDGVGVMVRMEQEPGSSGKTVIDHYQRMVLPGYSFKGDKPTGSKAARAMPFSVAAEAGNVRMVVGEWNRRFLDEMELFPNGAHDDQADSVSGAMVALAGYDRKQARLLV